MERLTAYEIEQMENDGNIAAFHDELASLYYEGFAEDLQRDDLPAYTEKLRQYINH